MFGQRSFGFADWGWRRRLTAVAGLLTFACAVFAAGHGLASGAVGDVLNVRFGGDGERTRVVLDLDRSTRGEVRETGAEGRVVLTLSGVTPARGTLNGRGAGLVRDYAVRGAGGGAEVELDLGRAVEIERRFLLPPGDGVDHYRYVVDLRAVGGTAQAAQPERPRERRAQPQRRPERPLIVIDPGHGGRDPGAQGTDTRESTVTLAAAETLKTELERSGRFRVRLTRESDVYIHPNRRMHIAREAGADLFISLHADAGADPATRGASIYTLSEQGAGRAVREFTDRDDWTTELHLPGQDPSVDRILLDMTQRATQNRSAQFARVLLTELEGDDHTLLRRSHRDAGLAVLLAPDVPAVLVEMGFITNPEDERALTDERQRRRLMRSVADAIGRYFDEPDAPLMVAGGSEGGSR